jgi:PhnB protein
MPEVQPVPDRLHTVNARLVFEHAVEAIEFYGRAFGAALVEEPYLAGDMLVHAELTIGDSVVMLSDQGDQGNGVAPASVGGEVTAILSINVPDVDTWWERAVEAGCEVVYPLADQFYGDRGGRLRDPFGHQWMLSTHVEDVSREEMDRRMQAWTDENT